MRGAMSIAICAVLILLVMYPQDSNVEAVDTSGTYGEGTTLICDNTNQRVIEVDEDGTILWSWESDGVHPVDAERLSGGVTMIVEVDYSSYPYYGRVIEVDPDGGIIWELGGLNLPYDAERLDNGNTLIACQHGNRVIEVEPDHDVVWEVSNNLKNTARTWLSYPIDVERLDNGNTLITDMYNDRVIEVEPDFDVVWETPWSGWLTLQDAKRLDNGNTLICSSSPGWNKVLEVDSSYNIVWEYFTYYPTDAHRLPNGNTLIAGGYGNYVKEVDPDKNVVWELTGVAYPCDVERLEPIIIIEGSADVDPDTLNLKSKGKWITVYIDLPEGYEECDIVIQSVIFEVGGEYGEFDTVEVEWGLVQDDSLMVKFSRAEVIDSIKAFEEQPEISAVITGEMGDGTQFECEGRWVYTGAGWKWFEH